MEQTVLVLTVGGACAPVVRAVADYRPDHVYFLCSTGKTGSTQMVVGPGTPCKSARTFRCPKCGTVTSTGDPDKPNILAQTGLTDEQYTIVELDDPDSLTRCYEQARRTLLGAMESHKGWRRIADYTGGTKTMTVGLAMAAVEAGWQLSLVKGDRVDLIQVLEGTEMAGLVNAQDVRARRRLHEVIRLFNDYFYRSAEEILSGLLRAEALHRDLQRQIQLWVIYCRGFDAWDRFDHQRAAKLLGAHAGNMVPSWRFLKRLAGEDPKSNTGYEFVYDLLRNAERRARQGRYDDAVARLYRALEMMAQIRLGQRKPPLDSGNLDTGMLPEDLRPTYEAMRDGDSRKIKLGLRQDYELLVALNDPLGHVFEKHQEKIIDSLSRRNDSILAHGNTPLDSVDYEKMAAWVEAFAEESLSALNISIQAPQFPRLSPEGLVHKDLAW